MAAFDVLITTQAEGELDEIVDFIRCQWPNHVKVDFWPPFQKRYNGYQACRTCIGLGNLNPQCVCVLSTATLQCTTG